MMIAAVLAMMVVYGTGLYLVMAAVEKMREKENEYDGE